MQSAIANRICSNHFTFPKSNFVLIPNFISDAEHDHLRNILPRSLLKQKYTPSHFDNVISDYREISAASWSDPLLDVVLKRWKSFIQNEMKIPEMRFIPLHILDMSNSAKMLKHVDNIEFSGKIVSAISLLSDCVIRFRKVSNENDFADVLIEKNSMYLQYGAVRYGYTHEILSEKGFYTFDGLKFKQQRRISLILRDVKTE